MLEWMSTVGGPVAACTICGGAIDDLVIVLGSSVGLTGLAIGFEAAFVRASRALGWDWAGDASRGESQSEVVQPSVEDTTTEPVPGRPGA